jgi:hypothetical protein
MRKARPRAADAASVPRNWALPITCFRVISGGIRGVVEEGPLPVEVGVAAGDGSFSLGTGFTPRIEASPFLYTCLSMSFGASKEALGVGWGGSSFLGSGFGAVTDSGSFSVFSISDGVGGR